LERELGMWDWEDKKAKKTTVLPTLQCPRGTHEKANLESKNETHSPRKKRKKRKKEKVNAVKNLLFFRVKGKTESEQTLTVPVTLLAPKRFPHTQLKPGFLLPVLFHHCPK